MEIELYEKPSKGATIIEGFPGFGLVSTIATEFLIEHLEAKPIGSIKSNKVSPVVALKKGKLVEALGIFYSKKSNIVIVRAISPVKNVEWDVTDALINLKKDIKAKEIISIEGIGSDGKEPEPEAFYYTNDKVRTNRLKSIGLKQLDEGIIVGVTAAMLSAVPEVTCIFAESYSDLPDSRAAAKIIEVLDKYLDLDVDYKPLMKKADTFEKKVKEIVSQGVKVTKQKNVKDEETYLG